MRIGFLASHRGSNMRAVLDACASGALRARPVLLVTNNADCGAARMAGEAGLPARILNSRTHPDPDHLDRAICGALEEAGCDWVVLAGFMKRVGPRVLGRFKDRIVNIHPSLLPRHGGQGMFGMRVHEAVLAAGDDLTGATVHLVDAEYDRGRVLARAEVPVLPGDTAETLAERVLLKEHELLPSVLASLADGAGEIAERVHAV
jgi:phosphoribosylglycinamide formyltransferase-1